MPPRKITTIDEDGHPMKPNQGTQFNPTKRTTTGSEITAGKGKKIKGGADNPGGQPAGYASHFKKPVTSKRGPSHIKGD